MYTEYAMILDHPWWYAHESFQMAKEKYGLTFHTRRQDNVIYRAYFPCHKKPRGSGYCGYYVFEFLKVNGRPPIPLKDRSLNELDLMNERW
ncbi:hypothetical protein U9M48_003228 [Paspalum notatum var. saurae]|uniref:Uncharacterized protein n=1 Tax=Paspalum notatum var. saurae TaxID=547442 RepID=A0AAQ3SJR3_PASNO